MYYHEENIHSMVAVNQSSAIGRIPRVKPRVNPARLHVPMSNQPVDIFYVTVYCCTYQILPVFKGLSAPSKPLHQRLSYIYYYLFIESTTLLIYITKLFSYFHINIRYYSFLFKLIQG